MWIKICANTNYEDAGLAVRLGADALGFVFAPSARRVTAEQVAAITARLPVGVEKIGVFYSSDPQEIADTIRVARLTGAQLHQSFSSVLVETLAGLCPSVRIIQTAHFDVDAEVGAGHTVPFSSLRDKPEIDAVLIDSRTATASGGTGLAFDWEAARGLLSDLAPKHLVVAGGLNAENVQEAIAVLQPWGVDVASGVEAEKGRKDPARLAAFIAQARSASRQ